MLFKNQRWRTQETGKTGFKEDSMKTGYGTTALTQPLSDTHQLGATAISFFGAHGHTAATALDDSATDQGAMTAQTGSTTGVSDGTVVG